MSYQLARCKGGRIAPFLFLLSLSYAVASQSPAELRIAGATQVLQQTPQSLQAHNDLAAALCERAAETGDPGFFSQADVALDAAKKIDSGDYTSQRIRLAVLLGEHRWAEALNTAKSLNHRVPDDLVVWCLLAEAHLALGNYAEAQKAAQWALDIRQGNVPAYRTTAKLREAFGDLDGATDLLNEAFRRTPESEYTSRAFLLTEMARLTLISGNAARAADLLTEAFRLNPHFHLALQVSASVEQAAGHYDKAVSLLSQRLHMVNTAEALFDYASALEQAGRREEAASAFHDFETKAIAQSEQPYNANRDLIFYYADHYADRSAGHAKALKLAERERSTLHDIGALDGFAWALFSSGKFKEARDQLKEALATGTRDPLVLSHAASIAVVAPAHGR